MLRRCCSLQLRRLSSAPPSAPVPPLPPPKRRQPKRNAPKRTAGRGVCAAYCLEGALRGGASRDAVRALPLCDQLLVVTQVEGAAGALDVQHAQLQVRERGEEHEAHVHIFASGAVVFWHVPHAVRKRALRALRAGLHRPHSAPTRMQHFDHEFGVSRAARAAFRDDHIALPPPPGEARPMLALAHGLAQSVELVVLERAVDQLAERTRAVPWRITAPRPGALDVAQLTAELLAVQYRLSLHSDILDVPQYFWSNHDLEQLYAETVAAVELRQRAEILGERVAVIRDALQLLNSEARARSSLRVERAILGLIAVEVALELAKLFGS